MRASENVLNWAGNYRYGARSVVHPENMDQLTEIVAGSARVRALGSRHSFSDLADTWGSLVALDLMSPDVVIDAAAQTVSVGAGATYGAVARALTRQGWALHNLASLPHISVAGAIATGTHGSGSRNGSLATAVVGLDLVTADGTLLAARPGSTPQWNGMVVSLGALGIVSRVILRIEPEFAVEQTVYENLRWDEVLADFDAVASAAYSVSLFTDWSGPTVAQAWLKRRTDQPAVPGRTFYSGTPAIVARHPLPEMAGDVCTQQLGVPGSWADRLAHFRMEFIPSNGSELQSEYLLPRQHASEALSILRHLAPQLAPLLLVGEVRTVAADEHWLSPAYGTDVVGLHFTWRQDWRAVDKLLELLERELGHLAPRPHWGKLFRLPPAELAQRYPRLPEFRSLAARLDPTGKFRNAFLDRTVFAPGPAGTDS